jgi:SAM-dependent methyltransferase
MSANAEQREHWNSEGADHWIRYEDAHRVMLEPFGRALLDAAAIRPDDRVLDVGCGTGWTTLRAGHAVGPAGEALGIDLSASMIAQARAHADTAGLPQVRFEVADAQIAGLDRTPFDVAISRFGVMFFDDPPAAFANLRRALLPGGRLCFVCWQELATNEWMLVPGAAVATQLPPPDLGADAGAPGPFSLSDPERIDSLLRGAGFAAIDVDPVETTLTLGGGLPLDDTLTYLRTSGLGRAVLAGATPVQVDAAMRAVRTALEPHTTPEGVRLGAAAWLVTARR